MQPIVIKLHTDICDHIIHLSTVSDFKFSLFRLTSNKLISLLSAVATVAPSGDYE